MNRRTLLFQVFTLLVALLQFIPAAGCTQAKLMSRQTDAYFSTVSALFLYDEPERSDEFTETWTQVKAILDQIERTVSLSFPDSDISRFNALACGQAMPVADITAEILTIAMDVHRATDGLYDPTVYPLIDLWGFSPRFNRNTYTPSAPYDRTYENGCLPLPDAQHIDALLPLIGLDGIRLYRQDGVWYLEKNTPPVMIGETLVETQLDLGGIAKGYACDRIRDCLLERGYTMGHFVCGDSSMAILSRPVEDGYYTLTLGKPRKGAGSTSHYASVRVRDTTLSTSSDATHAYMQDAVRYCHIIDPRTGYPMNMPEGGLQSGAASVTLLGASAAYGDAMSTALCLMRPQDAAAYIAAHLDGMTAVLAYYNSESEYFEVVSNAFDSLTLDDPAYIRACETGEDGILRYTGTFFSP